MTVALDDTFDLSGTGHGLCLDADGNVVVITDDGNYAIPGSASFEFDPNGPSFHYCNIRSGLAYTDNHQGPAGTVVTKSTVLLTKDVGRYS